MRIFKRGKFYHYEFIVNGQRVQKSSKLTNREDAKDAMSDERRRLVMGEPEKSPAALQACGNSRTPSSSGSARRETTNARGSSTRFAIADSAISRRSERRGSTR
jgi:hypothetical protein